MATAFPKHLREKQRQRVNSALPGRRGTPNIALAILRIIPRLSLSLLVEPSKMKFAYTFLLFASVSAFTPSKNAKISKPFLNSQSALSMADGEFDFDVAVIGCGVGGHGAALHSRAQGLSTAVFAGGDVGGTCVNRGCVPSKALLAASGRVREMRDSPHLESLGIEVDGEVKYSRQGIADHAKNLANRVKGNLENSLVGLGCDVIEGRGILTGEPHEIKDGATGKIYRAKVSLLVVWTMTDYFAFV